MLSREVIGHTSYLINSDVCWNKEDQQRCEEEEKRAKQEAEVCDVRRGTRWSNTDWLLTDWLLLLQLKKRTIDRRNSKDNVNDSKSKIIQSNGVPPSKMKEVIYS
jgi:hypothetical protein